MAQKEKLSKEREHLLAESKKALAGLGMSNESAVAEVLRETLGEELPSPGTISHSGGRHGASPNGSHRHRDVEDASGEESERVYNLPLDRLEPSPDQPRMYVEPDPEFIENIRVHGVRTPIHVRPLENGRYEIVAGERRWRACQTLGNSTIPALIRQASTDAAAAEALIDNLLRKNLSGFEEAKGYRKLIDQHHYRQNELAQSLGCDKTRISRALQVLDLPESILALTLGPGSPLSFTHVQELLPLRSNPARLERVARQAVDEQWTAKRIREEILRQPRTNQGAQSVRFTPKGNNGAFFLVVRFHPNRLNDVPVVMEALDQAREYVAQAQKKNLSS
ncbi:MAG: ParB/RepB/Spo0J family partition protein [Nitrospira sp.]